MKFLFRQLLLLFLPGLAAATLAQGPVVISGRITNAETGEGIDGVIVTCKESSRSVQSDAKGYYAFKTPKLERMKLEYRLLGFETQEQKLDQSSWLQIHADTLKLNIRLLIKPIAGAAAVIYSQKVDTVFGTMKYFVEDFEFYGDRFVLLCFEKSLKKAQVKLADENQKIISTTEIPDEAVELYKDFQGYINVICKEKIFRIYFKDEQLVLASLPVDQFKAEIMPCADTLKERILFSNYYRNYPAFSWFSYNTRDTSVKKLRAIKDKDLLELYEEEFDFLKPRDRLTARKLEISTGIDKRIIAAQMTNFPHSLYYTPLYAPLFTQGDTACIFDHYTDRLFRMNRKGALIDSLKISYHHPKDWKEWKHKLIQDRSTRTVYAVLQKGGFYILKKIDTHTGQITAEHRLANQYANHLKARNGYVYYIFRPFESGQTKFLYRETLPN
jgi:hypothetical protein